MTQAVDLFRKYKNIQFVFPDYTSHPKETVVYFKKFCVDYDFDYKIIKDPKEFSIKKGIAISGKLSTPLTIL